MKRCKDILGRLLFKIQVGLYSEHPGSARRACILNTTAKNPMHSVRKQWIYLLQHKFAASAIFSGTLDTRDISMDERLLTFRILVREQSDRIVDGDSLLGKAGMEALNNLTFYSE